MKRRQKYIFKLVRDANLNFGLVETGDRVAVGISGGKDSITLLFFLVLLQKYTPLDFELCPIYLDLGWNNDIAAVQEYCESIALPLRMEKTNIGQVVFDFRQEKNPCSLCANLRRGALNRTAKSLGCNKVALGHHADDAINTLFLSMLFEGRHNVFKPKTYLDRMDITVIRPLIYVEERDIELMVKALDLPVIKNRCPADGCTKRTEMKELVDGIEKQYPGARKKLLSSIENVNTESFWK